MNEHKANNSRSRSGREKFPVLALVLVDVTPWEFKKTNNLRIKIVFLVEFSGLFKNSFEATSLG